MTTETWQNIIIGATFLLGAVGLLLSILNYRIAKDSQRNSLREKVYETQFDFFMKWSQEIGIFETMVHDLNHNHFGKLQELKQAIMNKSNEIDLVVTQNDLIIPDEFMEKITKQVGLYFNVTTEVMKSEDGKIEKALLSLMTKQSIDLMIDMSDYLGVDSHGKENMSLIRRKARILK